MSRYYCDLHIHSCLSPCGDDDMTPGNIVGMACLNGLQIVALTDHNSVKNCPAFYKIAKKHGIIPKTIIKDIRDVIEIGKSEKDALKKGSEKKLTRLEKERLIEELTKQMKEASSKLEFEQAAYIRDRIKELRNQK